jgi:hypothetical protein
LANIYLAKLDRALGAKGEAFVRYADDHSETAGRTAGPETDRVGDHDLGLRLNQQKTKLMTIHQGVDFLGYRLILAKGHLHMYWDPKVLTHFREEVRRLTRWTAGMNLRTLVARVVRYLRGWGKYFTRAQVAGVFDRLDRWITRRLRAFLVKRWRNGLWRRYPNQFFWFRLHLTRLYHLRRAFRHDFEVRRIAGNRPVERGGGNPHATFVRGGGGFMLSILMEPPPTS